ncbi:MAG: glycosyltransferase [bacterium]|nr:glycosyltransferase [bacterium]
MKVLFITQFSEKGGSSRIHIIQFFPFLEKEGVKFRHTHIYPDVCFDVQMGVRQTSPAGKIFNLLFFGIVGVFKKIFVSLTASKFDAVVIQKETFPKILFWLLHAVNPNIIYEIDDAIFEINPYHKGGAIKNALLRYQAFLCKNMLKKSAYVLAENQYLAREARKYNEKVSVFTVSIDTDIFHPVGKKLYGSEVVIGWVGSPSTSHMLAGLLDAFTILKSKCSGWKLVSVGASPDFDMPGILLEKRQWTAELSVKNLQSFDIGLMPLDDSPFTRGRLGGKMIQYMAVGIPTVAQNVGLNPTIVKDGQNGFLVSDKNDWAEKLALLVRNPEMRQVLGQKAREICLKEFSISSRFEVLLRTLKRFSKK